MPEFWTVNIIHKCIAIKSKTNNFEILLRIITFLGQFLANKINWIRFNYSDY